MGELEWFGEEAENFRFPLIDVGGAILPGEYAAAAIQPGEDWTSAEGQGTQTGSETGSTTGSWPGSSAEAASGEAAHPIECGLIDHELEGLKIYHPQAREVFSSSSFVVYRIPIRLFSSLPYRATLLLEIPRGSRARRVRPRLPEFSLEPSESSFGSRAQFVPDVRAWAFWSGQGLIRSHHQLADASMCAYLPAQGLLGMTPLYEIVGMCICWIGKCLYSQVFGRWPGPQHYGGLMMRLRDRPGEFCGCGRMQRYGRCHRSEIESTPLRQLFMASMLERITYARELRWQGRPHYRWSWPVPGGL